MTSKVVALQAWCKHQCQGYKDVEITNMTTSWRSGLAFCAIIHRYHPELIDYDSLDKENIYENNKLAFDVAATLGISPFLDPEDMVALKVPDKLSILTYVSQYYSVFGKQKPRKSDEVLPIKRSADESLDTTSDGIKKKKDHASNIKDQSKGSTRTYVTSDDTCHICKAKVFLIERHFDSNHLYHHSCFRSLRTSQLESGGNQKVVEPQVSDSESIKTETKTKETEKLEKKDQQKQENKILKAVKFINLIPKNEENAKSKSEAKEESPVKVSRPKLSDDIRVDEKFPNEGIILAVGENLSSHKDVPKDFDKSLVTLRSDNVVSKDTNLKENFRSDKKVLKEITKPTLLDNSSTHNMIKNDLTKSCENYRVLKVEEEAGSDNKTLKEVFKPTVFEISVSADCKISEECVPKPRTIETENKLPKVAPETSRNADIELDDQVSIFNGNKNSCNLKNALLDNPELHANGHSLFQTAVITSSHPVAYSTNTVLPALSSYSDTLLSLNRPQEVKLSEVVLKNFKLEKVMSSEKRPNPPRIMDANTNNKLFDQFGTRSSNKMASSDDLSSSGSDSTVKLGRDSRLSVIDHVVEGGDSHRLSISVMCIDNTLNTNMKGKSIQFQDSIIGDNVITSSSSEFPFKSRPVSILSKTSTTSSALNHNFTAKAAMAEPDRTLRNVSSYEMTGQKPQTTRSIAESSKPSSLVGVISIARERMPNRTSPQVPPRSLSIYKTNDHLCLESSVTETYPQKKPVKLKHLANDDILREKIGDAPIPKPRIKKGVRYSTGGDMLELLPKEISSPTDQRRAPVNPLPRHKSFLESKKSKSPPPRPPLPVSIHATSSSTSLPSILKVHPWPLGHNAKPLRIAPVKPPRSRSPEKYLDPSSPRNTNLGSRDYKPYQVVCSTFPTDFHPLATPPNRPPPRPSEPPSKKKILPQSKFYFESISFDELEPESLFVPVTCKADVEKNEIYKKLRLIDEKLKKIETEGRILEQVIRSDNPDSLSDVNMVLWFNMINDRNELVRDETDLRYRCQQLDLEKEQANIEAQLRTLMMIPEKEKNSSQRRKEDLLIKKLLDIVGKRSSIVDSQENDRLRYLMEDEALKKKRESSLGEKKK